MAFSRVLIFRLAFLALYVVTGGISTEAVKGLQSSGFLFSRFLSRKSITFSKLQAMRLMLDKKQRNKKSKMLTGEHIKC